MRILFIVLTAISAFGLTARAEICEHRIFYLPDTHLVTGIPNVHGNTQDEETAVSQLKVAAYLDRFPQLPVFSEQATSTDLTVDQFSVDSLSGLRKMIDAIFPETKVGH